MRYSFFPRKALFFSLKFNSFFMSHDPIGAAYKGWIVTLLCPSSLLFVTLSAYKKVVCVVLFLLFCRGQILQNHDFAIDCNH